LIAATANIALRVLIVRNVRTALIAWSAKNVLIAKIATKKRITKNSIYFTYFDNDGGEKGYML